MRYSFGIWCKILHKYSFVSLTRWRYSYEKTIWQELRGLCGCRICRFHWWRHTSSRWRGVVQRKRTTDLEPVHARAKEDWRDMDLILLAKIVKMEADIRAAQVELYAASMMVENKRGTQIPNPLISVIDTLERRQLAMIRSMLLNQTVESSPEGCWWNWANCPIDELRHRRFNTFFGFFAPYPARATSAFTFAKIAAALVNFSRSKCAFYDHK